MKINPFKHTFSPLIIFLMACSTPQTSPENLDDLLTLTDKSETAICSLPLTKISQNIDKVDLRNWATQMSDMKTIASNNPDDFVKQVKLQLRRNALRRRILAEQGSDKLAQKFYNEFDDGLETPESFEGYHIKLRYWSERLSEQSQFNPDTPEYHIRFCALNEARATLHAEHRDFLLRKLESLREEDHTAFMKNLNHEGISPEGFKAHITEAILNPTYIHSLSPLERARLRNGPNFLPTDSQSVDIFLETLAEEVGAFIAHIEKTDYATPAEKFNDMEDVDQMLRKLFSPLMKGEHFENREDIDKAKLGLGNEITRADAFNTATIKTMLEGRGWFRDDIDGTGAGESAWLIVQHADLAPEFQAEALKLIEKELGAPGVSKSNYAYLYDRVYAQPADRENINSRKQRYGTQGRCVGLSKWEPFPVEDPENIDAIRAEVGLGTMAEYKSRFKDICVTAD